MNQFSGAVKTFVLAQSHADGDPRLALEMQNILILLQTCETQTKRGLQNIKNAVSQSEGAADAPTDLWHLSEEQIVRLQRYLASVNPDE